SGETKNGVTLGNNSIYYIDNGNFICRDFSGNEKWRYDGVGNNYNQAICAIQANGDIIVPGSQWLWGLTTEGSVKFRITMANFYSVITDKNNNIFAYFHGGYNVHDFACYNSQGDTLWTKSFTDHMPYSEMCLNVNGDIILGNFSRIHCYSTNTGFSSSNSSSCLPDKHFSVSPNPFASHLSISSSSSVSIYSLTGQLIMKLDKGKHSLDTSSWREGVYIIKSSSETRRIIKLK
ncbi:MAG: T9SS type A sorting domain-containing protein, partial [Candidatus Coatesbacteria bacterium]|nr:T9SS type A sorting domain-containing protein [Candidatus Coatesbacteria bacterium]